MAIYPSDFEGLPFAEQLDFLTRRVPVVAPDLRQVASEYHDWAFSVSRVTSADFLSYLYNLLNTAIAEGEDFDAFVERLSTEQFADQVVSNFSQRHMRVVFDTNIRRSHSAGRRMQLANSPRVRRLFIGRQWLHRDSPDFRPSHKAIDLKVFPADHEFWERAAPPCAYMCRCGTRLLTRSMIEQMGLTIEEPPDWRTIVEPPFTRAAGASNERQRQQYIQQGIARQPPELQSQLQDDLR